MKVAYLHGRPDAHYIHKDLARIWDADCFFVDDAFPWQSEASLPKWKRTWYWFKNAFSYKTYKHYNIILVDNLHFAPIIARKLGIFRKNQKLIVHLGSHTLYFIDKKRFGFFNRKLHIWALNQYDEIICEGMYSLQIAKQLLHKPEKAHYSFLGPKKERVVMLQQINPLLNGTKILNISQVEDNRFRWDYKGIDIMLHGFESALNTFPNLELILIGNFGTTLKEEVLNNLKEETRERITFTGYVQNLETYYKEADLYLHVARGDAFPTTSVEAMHAGIPCLVSEDTGTKEILSKVSDSLICQTTAKSCGEHIITYFNMKPEERKSLSEKLKQAVETYSEMNAHSNYRSILARIMKRNEK